MNWKQIFQAVMAVSVFSPVVGAAELSDLTAECRNGQVFLRWKEAGLPADARLAVWSSDRPISSERLEDSECVAKLLNTGSARDWWLDQASFLVPRGNTRKSEEIFAGGDSSAASATAQTAGFVIADGAAPLDPASGLHVHTPTPEQSGMRYFAVAWQSDLKGPVRQVLALEQPVEVKSGPIRPITVKGPVLERGSASGKPLTISLHGRGGGVGVDTKGNPQGTHLWFADRSVAWREGIPFKFAVSAGRNQVQIVLFDRVWIGRPLTKKESSDARDYVPAIATFWLGYNPNIAVSNLGPEFKFDNYTERFILQVIRWAQEYLGTDPNRTYVTGGSMGGTGAIQLVTHFPEVFAAAHALVPVYSYTWKKCEGIAASAGRLVCSGGPFTEKNPARMPDGRDILEYGDGARNIARPEIDMPPIFATNGRNDKSIPWVNNPPFYQAANTARQALTVYWNDGGHGMSNQLPADMKEASNRGLLRYRLNSSFPAFSNVSDNRDFGNGDPTNGDATGWLNRGMDWNEKVIDQADRYEISLTAFHPEIQYPVTADVTLRRRQQFRPVAGETLQVQVNGETRRLTVPANGLITIEKINFPDKNPVQLTISR